MDQETNKKVRPEELQERFETLIMVSGKERLWTAIVHDYIQLIESGFDLTLEEMAAYFDCTPEFAMKHFRGRFRHILITRTVRKMLMKAMNEQLISEDEPWVPLLKKRVLFCRLDLQDFVKELPVETRFGYLDWSHFSFGPEALAKPGQPTNDAAGRLVLTQAALKLYGEEHPVIQPLGCLPDRLYSLKSLKELRKDRHNVETYRYLERMGANKIKFRGLVRYDLNSFKDKAAAVPIQAFKHGNERHVAAMIEKMVNRMKAQAKDKEIT